MTIKQIRYHKQNINKHHNFVSHIQIICENVMINIRKLPAINLRTTNSRTQNKLKHFHSTNHSNKLSIHIRFEEREHFLYLYVYEPKL